MSLLTLLGMGFSAWLAYQWALFRISEKKLRHIPTVGGDGFISSYLSAWRYLKHGREIIQEGYEKYPGTVFKVATLATPNRWMIVANGANIVDDIRKSNEEELSFHEAANEIFHNKYLFPKDTGHPRSKHYHVEVIRGPLTKGFPGRFDDIKEEIEASLRDLMPATKDWTGYPVHKSFLSVVCRTTNRLFVGIPLCREPDYLRINETLTIHLFTVGGILNLIPSFLRPIVAPLLSKFPAETERAKKYLEPLINERKELDAKFGPKWEGRPNDLISWLIDVAPEEDGYGHLDDLVLRILTINTASIHTTTITVSNVLFDLAAHPEYIGPLREEIEETINRYGWTKESMVRMHKLDSTIKENSRRAGLGAAIMHRKTKVDFKLSNGVVIPKGFRMVVASGPTHSDPNLYEDPQGFHPFRFVQSGEDKSGPTHKLRNPSMVALDPNYVLFGGGRFACPGRWFAVNEIKAMLCYMLMNYDFKLAGDKPPEPRWFGHARAPNTMAELLFRKRQIE
ncbi:cytochrome P450 [Coprinopsis cinerea okayama7|uniref:Cytochrome P450 n=1 Tax=Coprinopsis cinerea (strain Okayama-7 / 130 / ATCC MYA-4618 / FGSC 9003) TaxID=240176 RepID=A8NI48_COPC7|nr:cytochrome P450 [Coprinopsis cinerea okayama7\|eukprot:XP_001833906.1 cytochrome P450 [Coprinopsis cinerea okayama7\